jgi:hypothetical protein
MGNRPLFDRSKHVSTTGDLLVEVGRFAGYNLEFRQTGNKAAARKARKHLSQIMKLAEKRSAEIAVEMDAVSSEMNEPGIKERHQEKAA